MVLRKITRTYSIEVELAELLEKVENKSEIINGLLRQHFKDILERNRGAIDE